MTKIRLGLASLAAVALFLGACSSGTSGQDEEAEEIQQEESATPTEPDDQVEESNDEETTEVEGASDNAVLGTVDVDGVGYEITSVRNCEPRGSDVVDRELEVQGLGEHNGERFQIDVYIQTVSGMQMDEVSWAGPEGIFGGPETVEVTLSGSGNRVSGMGVLVDAMEQTETVTVDFDIELTPEKINCD